MRTAWAAKAGSGWTVGGDRGWTTLPNGNASDPVNLYGASTPNGVRLLNLLIGDNGNPSSKTAAFGALLAGGFGAKLSASRDAQGNPNGYAFMKWCFGDFDGSTNVRAVFDDYKTKLHAWKAAYPNIMFFHSTVPVTGPSVDGNNPYREAMSDLLRSDSEVTADGLYDLADFEARNLTTGQYDSLSYDGNHVRMLRNEYAPNDYCHPSLPAEEDWLGQKLIDFLYDHL